MRYLSSLVASFVILAVLAGCGSSSGGGGFGGSGALILPDANGLFTGTYQFVGFSGDNSGPEELEAFWGDATADGLGTLEKELNANNTGVLNLGIGPLDFDYQVHVDYGFTVGNFGPGAYYARGGISADGTLAAVSTVFEGIRPMMWVYGRRAPGTNSDATVQGTWRFARYTANTAIPLNVTGWGSLEFDGMGAGTYEESNNQEGVTFGPINPPLGYEVFADGRIGIQFGADNVVHGSLMEGGNVIVCSGSSVAGGPPSIYVLVRAAVGMSDANFSGIYSLVGFAHEAVGNRYSTFTGTLAPDGMGMAQYIGMRNEDGTTTTAANGAFSYAVAPDGSVELVTTGGEILHGQLSADGTVLAAAGASNPGSDTTFLLIFR